MVDQTLLSALAPVTIIFTLILGKFMLHEEVYLKHYIACIFMAAGTILALIFAHKHSKTYNIQEIKERIFRLLSLFISGTNLLILSTLNIVSIKILRDIKACSWFYSDKELENCLLKKEHLRAPTTNPDESIESETTEVEGQIPKFSSLRPVIFQNLRWLRLPVVTFPWFAGFMSGMTSLFAKWTIMILSNFYDNSDSCWSYLIPVLLWKTAVSEMVFLNLGFKYFDTAVVIPIFKASIEFHNTMWGGVLLAEFRKFTVLSTFMYALGILVCILGILIMLVNCKREGGRGKGFDDGVKVRLVNDDF